MPKSITVPDKPTDDELTLLDVDLNDSDDQFLASSPIPLAKPSSRESLHSPDEGDSSPEVVKVHETDDIFFSPRRHSFSESETEDVNDHNKASGNSDASSNKFLTIRVDRTGSPCNITDCDHSTCNFIENNSDLLSCNVAGCDHSSCNIANKNSLSMFNSDQDKQTTSSDLTSRMRQLANFKDYDRKSRSTGMKSHATFNFSCNDGVPSKFWEMHPWADRTAGMCSPEELDCWISKKRLDHLSNEIAPWFTTAWPVDHIDRRYWSYNHEDGTTWVSRTRAQVKNFFLRGKPIDECDRCVICKKLLISPYHVFMPVYEFQDHPPKALVWQWQDSVEKACYFHFTSKTKSEDIPGRNPNSLNDKRARHTRRSFHDARPLPPILVKQSEIEVPEDY